MTTPSAILSRAADLIRDTAAVATPGPWGSTTDENADVTFFGRNDAENGQALTTIAGLYHGEHAATGRWIALMSPAVADAQERILRASSAAWVKAEESYRRDRSVINPSPGELSGHWGTWGMTLEERVGEADRAALALARAVLGEKEEQ